MAMTGFVIHSSTLLPIVRAKRDECGMDWSYLARRLYWVVVAAVFLYFMNSIFQKLRESFIKNSVTFTMDTGYLDWNTTFPSISVCQALNEDSLMKSLEKIYGEDRNTDLDELISDIVFFTGTCNTCERCGDDLDCPTNFTDIVDQFRTPCQRLLSNCSWNQAPFECCTLFLPLQTEFGVCYSINSAITDPPYGRILLSNRFLGPSQLKFSASEDIQLHVHTPFEIPYALADQINTETVFFGLKKKLIIKVRDIINDESVRGLSFEQRVCRFPDERLDGHNIYNSHSHSTCSTEIMLKAQMQFCNCTHHLMPAKKGQNANICDTKGLTCLTERYVDISKLRRNPECLDCCEESEYSFVYRSKDNTLGTINSQISIGLHELPHEKLIRKAVKTNLDFLISIGGLVGLFFGASIIGSIDILYHNVYKFGLEQVSKWINFVIAYRNKKKLLDAMK